MTIRKAQTNARKSAKGGGGNIKNVFTSKTAKLAMLIVKNVREEGKKDKENIIQYVYYLQNRHRTNARE